MISSGFKVKRLSKNSILATKNGLPHTIARLGDVGIWEPSLGTLPIVRCVVQQSWGGNGTQSPGNHLSVCTEEKLTGAEERAEIQTSEQWWGKWRSVCMDFPATEVAKWKHISPLTAAAEPTLWVELLVMLCVLEVEHWGVPEACCLLSKIRLN